LARILWGETYWADLNPVRSREQAGLRPVLILSHDLFNRKSETGQWALQASRKKPASL
jgi:mRNA interferase MazF